MGRTAVVTGAAGGFGRAVVADLVAAGWDVVAVVRPGGTALPAAGRLDVVAADLRQDPGPALGSVLGDRPVDLLVSNAATGTTVRGLDVDPAVLLDVLDVNAVAALRLVQALLPSLLAAPDPLVLNVSSRLGSVADQAEGRYRALSTS